MKKDLLAAIRPNVREMRVYVPTTETVRIQLAMNENPFPTPPAILAETEKRWKKIGWNRYPDASQKVLRENLAKFNDWLPEGIVVGNGSNELIQAVMLATLADYRRVLISEPTFSIYRQVAQLLDATILSVPLNAELNHDVAAICLAITEHQPFLTMLCSPNNPTGKALSETSLRQILRTAKGLVVVDEAYYEFADKTFLPLVREFPKLIIFRTFSKSLGMPAFRLGYALMTPEIAGEIRKTVLPFNVDAFSQTAASVATEMYEAEIAPMLQQIIEERNRLFTELKKIKGLSPVPSKANFILVKSEIPPSSVVEKLLKSGILIRDVSANPQLKDYFRISTGKPAENDELIENLRQIFA